MRTLLFLAMFGWTISTFAHGGHMATQKFIFNENSIELEFKIDVNTFNHFGKEVFGKDYEKKKGLVIANYINEKLKFLINDQRVDFEFISSNQNEHYLIVNLRSKAITLSNSKVKIESIFFYEKDPLFENRIIIITATGKSTSYRLKKTNPSITTDILVQ